MSTAITCLSTFSGAFVSSFVPVLNAEFLLLGAVAISPPELGLVLVALTAVGQMGGKVVLYYVGRGAVRLKPTRASGAVRGISRFMKRRPSLVNVVLFASASFGIPPFYAVTLAAGALGTRVTAFVLLGLTGHFIRFYLLVLAAGAAVRGLL